MAFSDLVWGVLGSQQFGNLLLVLLTIKVIDYDHNLANIIDAIREMEQAPNIYYETIFPFKPPRFNAKKVRKR